ncbi:MAG: hypothetical protein WD379_02110 [Dehalococcoidia bacterium]
MSNDGWRHVEFAFVGIAAAVVGSLCIAFGVDSQGEDTFLDSFLVAIGVSLMLFGVGTAIASVTTYLTSRR